MFFFAVLAAATCKAQNPDAQKGTVILNNGDKIEGLIQKQGNEVIVTKDEYVFYYSMSEVSDILIGKSRDSSDSSHAGNPNLSFKQYKEDAFYAYGSPREAEFWMGNRTSLRYYERYASYYNLTYGTLYAGVLLCCIGLPCFAGDSVGCLVTGSIATALGTPALITAATYGIIRASLLKRSYKCYSGYGQNLSVNITATPVFYAQGGAGIGIALKF